MNRIKKSIINFTFIFLLLFFNINTICFANIEKENEINKILSEKENWISGMYYPWQGTFSESTTTYCLKNPIYIEPGTYYISINDPRFQLAIHQFDNNKKWINNYKGGLVDKSTITIDDTTSYIKINLSSNVWGINPYDYFDYGLSINISKEYITNSLKKINLIDANLQDMTKIKSGLILAKNGQPGLDLNKVYINNYFSVDDTKYVVNLPDPFMRMEIIEFDETNNAITSSILQPGRTWEKQKQTSYIAINISSSNKQKKYFYENYIEELSEYEKPCLTKYTKYNHNTEFDTNFKAYDFAQKMNIGWNLGDALGSGYCTEVGEDTNLMLECSWGNPYITKDLIDCVAAQGFNTIRIPVTWYPNCKIDENGHYIIGKQWLNRVQDVVDYAIENDMYVIINTMCDEGNLFYVGVEDKVEWNHVMQNSSDLWSQIAEFFKDYDEHLIFESYNEIGTKSGWTYSKLATSQINELNQVFTDAVRKTGGNNKYRLLMVPTYITSAKENITADFKLPQDENPGRIMISTHVYDEIYDEDIEWKFQSLENFSIQVDAPIIIGEFGMNSKSQIQILREIHMSNYVARATAHGLKCCVWDDNYNWQLIDRWNYSNIKTNLIKAMFQGYNEGIAYRTTKNKVYYTDINQFHIGGVNLGNGSIWNTDYSTSWWGGLVPLNDTKTSTKIKIPDNTDYISFNIKTIKEAAEVWIVGVTWFDKDGNYLTYSKSQEITRRYKLIEVPEGAKYFSAGFHDPYINHTVAEYGKWLKEGKVALDITYINKEDFGLEKEIVNVSNYNYINRTPREIIENKQYENFNNCDLQNVYNWVSGTYSTENGQYCTSASKICLKDYKIVKEGTEYNIKISDDNYKLDIFELDKDFNFKKVNQKLSNGDKYIIPNDVQYISICLYKDTNITFNEYKEAFTTNTPFVEFENISNNNEAQQPSEDISNDSPIKDNEEQQPSKDNSNDSPIKDDEEQQPENNSNDLPIEDDGEQQPSENNSNDLPIMDAEEQQPQKNNSNDLPIKDDEEQPSKDISNDSPIKNDKKQQPSKQNNTINSKKENINNVETNKNTTISLKEFPKTGTSNKTFLIIPLFIILFLSLSSYLYKIFNKLK